MSQLSVIQALVSKYHSALLHDGMTVQANRRIKSQAEKQNYICISCCKNPSMEMKVQQLDKRKSFRENVLWVDCQRENDPRNYLDVGCDSTVSGAGVTFELPNQQASFIVQPRRLSSVLTCMWIILYFNDWFTNRLIKPVLLSNTVVHLYIKLTWSHPADTLTCQPIGVRSRKRLLVNLLIFSCRSLHCDLQNTMKTQANKLNTDMKSTQTFASKKLEYKSTFKSFKGKFTKD